ncbi:enoyl-CoA hydratase/isomerase family protein [Acetobacteraceae bacterium H6797]|nr:enoyl-CoA hydratase/isomerase family protein [Acetobacteraceae bacterium H6797]
MIERAGGKILASVTDGVGRVVFNQPEKRNAMSVEMWAGMVESLDAFEADPEVRVVVLAGAGDKAFVSGADISQFEKNRADFDAQREYDKITSSGRRRLAAFPKPVIASIRGFCLGGGLGIAMNTDLRIAADDAQFGIPAAKLGIAYTMDMVSLLTSLVGPAHARMMLYSGERIDAAEAQRIGLVNRTVPVEQLEQVVNKLASTLAANAPLTMRAAKLTVTAAITDASLREMGAVDEAIAACFDSEDYREGRRAFMEKRKPDFKGR